MEKELAQAIDDILARVEDYTHGKDGEDITKARKELQKYLFSHSQDREVEDLKSDLRLMKESYLDLQNIDVFKSSQIAKLKKENEELKEKNYVGGKMLNNANRDLDFMQKEKDKYFELWTSLEEAYSNCMSKHEQLKSDK